MARTIALDEAVAARRRHLGGWPDIAFFGGATVTGGLGMYVLKFVHAPQWMVTGFVLATMFVYASVVFLVPRMRLRSDQAGDNAYYLGLLFTLTSMAFALHEFGLAQGADFGAGLRLHVGRVIGDFGVALASTITGIFLRILLHQMRVDPQDIEEAARLELVGAAARVREQVRQVVDELGQYHQQVSQRRQDEINELVGAFRQIGEAAAAEVGHAMRPIEAAVHGVRSRLDSMLGDLESGLRTSAEALAESAGRIQAVKLPTAAVSNRLDRIAGSLEGIAERLEVVDGSLFQIQNRYRDSEGAARAEIDNAIASAQLLTNTATMVQEGLAEAFGKLSEAVERSTRAIAENAQAVASLQAESRTAVRAVEEAQAAAAVALSALAEHESAAHAEVENTIARTHQLTNVAKVVHDGLTDAFRELSDAVGSSTRAIAENAHAVASLQAESRTAVRAVEEAQAAAVAVLSALAEHSASLARAIRATTEGSGHHFDAQEPSSGGT